uniref:Uncharacterized protein n=1 Tax=Tanacetum cinerariifolium TaxID=118510 RepID=A0A6L2JLI1_TANCI|nr:hypothetical protein [Tanacetum cinerariifolium]
MGDENPIRTLEDYSKPSHEGYMNTIELPKENNVNEGWNDPIFPEEGSLNDKNPDIKQLLGIMENRVDALMKDAVSIMGRSEDVCEMTSDMIRQLKAEPSHQEAFKDLVMNFIHDQKEKVKQLEEYMCVIRSDFMQLSSKVIEILKEEIRIKENGVKKIEKITRCLDTEDLEPLNGHEFSEALTEKTSHEALQSLWQST